MTEIIQKKLLNVTMRGLLSDFGSPIPICTYTCAFATPSSMYDVCVKLSQNFRAFSALRNYPMFFPPDFPQLLDALGKSLKFHFNMWSLQKLLNALLDLYFYWFSITCIFRSSRATSLSWMWFSYLSSRSEDLKTRLFLFKKWEEYKLFRIISFS